MKNKDQYSERIVRNSVREREVRRVEGDDERRREGGEKGRGR